MTFQLKGGTSLSKGYQIINRFSEDIDIRIEPPKERQVRTGKNHNKAKDVRARRDFFDWVAKQISFDGIEKVERDTAFDNMHMTSAGIRLTYKTSTEGMEGLRPGVLLEAGFDEVSPNSAKDISSWVYDHAVAKKVSIIDNRMMGTRCGPRSRTPRGSLAARSSGPMSTKDTAATMCQTHTAFSSPDRSVACSAPSSASCDAAPPSSP